VYIDLCCCARMCRCVSVVHVACYLRGNCIVVNVCVVRCVMRCVVCRVECYVMRDVVCCAVFLYVAFVYCLLCVSFVCCLPR
jgi:hypothetical protein